MLSGVQTPIRFFCSGTPKTYLDRASAPNTASEIGSNTNTAFFSIPLIFSSLNVSLYLARGRTDRHDKIIRRRSAHIFHAMLLIRTHKADPARPQPVCFAIHGQLQLPLAR